MMLNYLAAAAENRVPHGEPGFLTLVLVLIVSGLLGGLVAFFADLSLQTREIQEPKAKEARITNQLIKQRCLINREVIKLYKAHVAWAGSLFCCSTFLEYHL